MNFICIVRHHGARVGSNRRRVADAVAYEEKKRSAGTQREGKGRKGKEREGKGRKGGIHVEDLACTPPHPSHHHPHRHSLCAVCTQCAHHVTRTWPSRQSVHCAIAIAIAGSSRWRKFWSKTASENRSATDRRAASWILRRSAAPGKGVPGRRPGRDRNTQYYGKGTERQTGRQRDREKDRHGLEREIERAVDGCRWWWYWWWRWWW